MRAIGSGKIYKSAEEGAGGKSWIWAPRVSSWISKKMSTWNEVKYFERSIEGGHSHDEGVGQILEFPQLLKMPFLVPTGVPHELTLFACLFTFVGRKGGYPGRFPAPTRIYVVRPPDKSHQESLPHPNIPKPRAFMSRPSDSTSSSAHPHSNVLAPCSCCALAHTLLPHPNAIASPAPASMIMPAAAVPSRRGHPSFELL